MRPVVTWDVWWKRLAAAGALLVVLLVVLAGLGLVIGFPDGYASAQSSAARDLAARDDWRDLRRGATLDIVVFVPAYVAGAVVVARLVTAARKQLVVAIAPLGLGAIADLVETLLFRRSLSRLIGGATADDIEALANATRVATVFKYGGILVSAVALVTIAIRGD